MMLRPSLLVLAILLSLAACSKSPADAGKDASASASALAPLMITAEDVITITTNALASGPVITGSIQPERRADLRAEVSAIVLQVLKENGDLVKRGDLLMRLDDTSIRDSLNSAEEAARASAQSFEQAEKQLQRVKTLRTSGMASAQSLDDAETRRNNAQSDLVAAKSRAVTARQQLQRTEVRAPFEGIVSERKASVGDTASIGKELVKVIDPTSMRLEGLVSADKIAEVKQGQKVSFRVNGQEQKEYLGTVRRVDPAANPTTRQVAVLVSFDDGAQPRVAGLYAEGRIETSSVPALMLAQASLVRDGDKTYCWRLKNGVLNKVELAIGKRDARRGDYMVMSGLVAGDKVIRNPVSTLKDGQKADIVASVGAVASDAAVGSAGK